MCGRYYLDTIDDAYVKEAVTAAKASADKLGIEMKTSGDVRPTDIAPVIAPSSVSRKPIAFPMKWGFPHPKKEKILVFNTRSETAEEKDLFCTSIDERRCLVPVSGYYEWKKQEKGKSEKFRFKGEEPLYLAGLYIRSSKAVLPCFSILTMDAALAVRDIHLRMPVIVTGAQMEEWLSGRLLIREAPLWSFGKDRIRCESCDRPVTSDIQPT